MPDGPYDDYSTVTSESLQIAETLPNIGEVVDKVLEQNRQILEINREITKLLTLYRVTSSVSGDTSCPPSAQ